MASAIFELILFSLPSLLYARRLHRTGASRRHARKVVGLQPGRKLDYLLAGVITPLGIALALVLLNLVPTEVLHGGTKNIVGTPTTAGGYAAIIVAALAEEMLFRGFLAGLLFRRFGFATGNARSKPPCSSLRTCSCYWSDQPVADPAAATNRRMGTRRAPATLKQHRAALAAALTHQPRRRPPPRQMSTWRSRRHSHVISPTAGSLASNHGSPRGLALHVRNRSTPIAST